MALNRITSREKRYKRVFFSKYIFCNVTTNKYFSVTAFQNILSFCLNIAQFEIWFFNMVKISFWLKKVFRRWQENGKINDEYFCLITLAVSDKLQLQIKESNSICMQKQYIGSTLARVAATGHYNVPFRFRITNYTWTIIFITSVINFIT